MSKSSDVKLKTKLGSPMMRSSGCERTAAFIVSAVAKISFAYLRYPSRPSDTSAAQVAASRPPERDPSMPGEQYLPPVQPVRKKYCPLRSALSRNASTDVPLNAYPYLCVSAEMLVTPGTRKSRLGMSQPSSWPNGRIQPPRQPSTCRPMLCC